MTLDEQIEWLEQEAEADYDLAKDFLSIHSMKEYAWYNYIANKYQEIADSLKDYKELKQ